MFLVYYSFVCTFSRFFFFLSRKLRSKSMNENDRFSHLPHWLITFLLSLSGTTQRILERKQRKKRARKETRQTVVVVVV